MSQRRAIEQHLQAITLNLIKKLTRVLSAPVSVQQKLSTRDTPAKGPIWVSRTMINKPDCSHELKAVLRSAFEALAIDKQIIDDFSLEDVSIQWTAFRPAGEIHEPEPPITDREKYERIMKDVTTDAVILYVHGGFYYSGGPASVRNTTLALARETGGRCIVPYYRLAPQNPFPAALIDVFLVYLSLMYPGEGAMHTPVLVENIVFAGDSSGGNLVLSLLALLQHIREHHQGQAQFQGRRVNVPFPAGVATLSAHCDHTLSFDSYVRNKPYDIFNLDLLPYLQPTFPACEAWPAKPPREDIYCDGRTLLHSLVSVAIAPCWSAPDLPPIFMATGQELLTDEQNYLAKRAEQAGATVQFSQYDALPHTFSTHFPNLPQSRHVLQRWGEFCKEVVKNPKGLKSEWIRYHADDTEFTGVELVLPVDLDQEKRIEVMKEKVAKRKPWTGPTKTAML